jgi:CRP-like cAMP-binding protein
VQPSDAATVLAATPLFSALDTEALDELAAQVERVQVVGGETLIREGDPGDCLYVVAGGRLAVVVNSPNGTEHTVAEIGRGETVGEMALLSGSPRSATVRAIRDSLLLKFSKASFDRMLERHPRTTMELARLIVLRLEQSIHGRATVRPRRQRSLSHRLEMARQLATSPSSSRNSCETRAYGAPDIRAVHPSDCAATGSTE